MNQFTFSVSDFAVIISFPLRIITGIILLAFLIPLQFKYVNVKNGLSAMRKAWIAIGILLFFINTVGLIIIVFRPFVNTVVLRSFTDIISILNSLGFLTIALLMYLLWRGQFTPKNIRLHEMIEIEERKQDRKDKQDKIDKKKKKG